MQGVVNEERQREFQEKMSNWISAQGFFFQIRHASIGSRGSFLRQLSAIFIRLLFFLLILAGIAYFFFIRWINSDKFNTIISEKIESSFDFNECQIDEYSRQDGQMVIGKFTGTGNESSFFSKVEVTRFKSQLPLTVALGERWDAGEIQISSAKFSLNAGGDEKLEGSYSKLFWDQDRFSCSGVFVQSATFDWGYSLLTYGRVRDTKLKATRTSQDDWRVSLEGGFFMQNWLHEVEIIKMELLVSEDGVEIEEAQFRLEGGEIEMTGEVAGTEVEPEFDLRFQFQKMPLATIIDSRTFDITEYLGGEVDGEFQMTGTTAKKLITKGKVEVVEGSTLFLRDKWPILRALSLVDVDQTYSKIDFVRGGFSFETESGELKLTNINLETDDNLSLSGNFQTRLPSQKEAAEALGLSLTTGEGGALNRSFAKNLESMRMLLEMGDWTQTGRKKDSDDENQWHSIFDSINLKNEDERIDAVQLMREMISYRIVGELDLKILSSAFAGFPQIQEIYELSTDEKTYTIPLKLNEVVSKATQKEASQLMKASKRDFRNRQEGSD